MPLRELTSEQRSKRSKEVSRPVCRGKRVPHSHILCSGPGARRGRYAWPTARRPVGRAGWALEDAVRTLGFILSERGIHWKVFYQVSPTIWFIFLKDLPGC